MIRFKKFIIITLGFLLLSLGTLFLSCSKDQEQVQLTSHEMYPEKEILYYTCGMHPSVKVSPEDYDKGNKNCPICNMELIPVYKEKSSEMEMESEEYKAGVTQIRLSQRAQALAQVKTEEIGFQHLFKEINSVGHVDYDERKVAYVASWIPGRIDNLFIDFTGINIKKGAPLVSIYSPNLVTTQEEYLLAIETLDKLKRSRNEETIRGAESLVEASKKRLLLWGINEVQIDELEERKKANTNMTIYAPIGGTVINKNAVEGKYVKEGENLYQIADLSNLWVLADIYEYEISWIRKGQEAEITSSAYPGEKFEGRLSFIDPYLNPKTRTIKARVDVKNPQLKLKPGMFVTMLIKSQVHQGIHSPTKIIYTCPMHPEITSQKPGECSICGMYLEKRIKTNSHAVLAVPRSAVLDTGVRKLVYIEKDKGIYQGKEIEIGSAAMALINGQKRKFFVIKSGLSEGMKVVTQANFLIDSQSQITGQAEAIYSGAIEAEEKQKTLPSKHIH